ncbi:MAG: Rdx family protein [Anaerolineales bacterium]|nr:Rdx family protein [Anaerolineales bacterium]
MKNFESDIACVDLVPSDGGRFEVAINDQLIFSKLQTGRRAEVSEIIGLLRKHIKEG